MCSAFIGPGLIASNKDLVRHERTNAYVRQAAVVRDRTPLIMAKAESLRASGATDSPTRRAEILATAASLIASSGLRTSLQEIADAAGILPGSLYHHFESKEAILVELIRCYQDDLERIGRSAKAKLPASAM